MKISRILALLMALVFAGAGVGLLALAAGEVPDRTRTVSGCVNSAEVVAETRYGRRRTSTSWNLVIATGEHPQIFVHNLGSLWPDKDLANQIQPGLCVDITVDEQAFQKQSAPRYEKSIIFEWLGFENPYVVVNGNRRVKILALSSGPDELISYADSLGWDLGTAGLVVLVLFALSGVMLLAMVRGPTVGEVEPVSFVSPEGFSLSLDRDGLTYREDGRALRIAVEQELRPKRLRLYTGTLRAWSAPDGLEPLDFGDRDRIIRRIERWLALENVDYAIDDGV